MELTTLLVASQLLACGTTRKIVCDDGPRYVQRDCRAYYETTAKSSLFDVGAEVGTLAGVSVGGNVTLGKEITSLAEAYDNLQVQYMNTLVALCERSASAPCSMDPNQQQDLILALNTEMLEARSALASANQAAEGGKAAEAEVQEAIARSVDQAEASFTRIQALLAEAGVE